jgi:hypothetical protein
MMLVGFAMELISLAPGFGQVTMVSTQTPKPFKRFPVHARRDDHLGESRC